MPATVRPAAEWELSSLIVDAAERGKPVEVIGAGSKRGIGRAMQAALIISTSGMRGITLYEPTELVMSALAGTPAADVEAELAARGQMLPFEPVDVGPALGAPSGRGSIGAVFATNLSGARRVAAGAARDHLLGVRAINGRGETFKSGGRVLKNVTGYDVARGLAGSWGTLGIMTEVTFKVVPRPERTATLALLGLTDELAAEVMCEALGTPFEVSGAVHLPRGMAGRLATPALRDAGQAVTALRVENLESFVSYRCGKLRERLAPYGEVQRFDGDVSLAFWGELRQLSVLQGGTKPLWRISTTPTAGPKVVSAVGRYMAVEAFYDWSGGLIWLEVPDSADAGATDIRRVIAQHGGHATLVRADIGVRAAVDVFQPLDPGVERLTRGLKAAFDPAGILNPGRMYASL
ncbi:MAG: FAD-binding protein [Hyphomicrobiaceae bacterium]|nr:FAD-binding protein [Hyphomicrobiaceae bacterium]